jgi:hypothetical protein
VPAKCPAHIFPSVSLMIFVNEYKFSNFLALKHFPFSHYRCPYVQRVPFKKIFLNYYERTYLKQIESLFFGPTASLNEELCFVFPGLAMSSSQRNCS